MGQVTEADAAVGVRFLPASTRPEDVKKAQAIFPGGNFEIWEPGPAGIKEKTPLWTYPINIVTSTSLPDSVAEVLLEAWWNNLAEIQKLHSAFARMQKPEMFVLEQISIPYHEGAVKFFKKKGAWSPKMDTIQQRLLKGEYPFLD
ncbi:MAG: TAXI family TRAP transporter solute-binding subunit, partial [Dehalococcoidia bacterium]|nr:TAXI family TRAP transporter solute-binding subunit [Dehalococcoidia bacterium]